MNELKLFVERCVRPVKAEGSKKLEMRRELYSHLQSVYEQEQKRTGNDEAAIQAAMARMGNPNELTEELNASLSLLDSWTGKVDMFSCRGIHESPWQYAVRFARLTLKVSLAILVPFVVVSILIAGEWGFRQQFLTRFCAALILIEALGCLMCGWFIAMLRDQLEQNGWEKHLVPLVLKIGAALLLIIPVAGWAFFYGVSGDAAEATAFLPRWFLLGLLAGPGILWAAWLDAKLTRDLREWQELQIDQ